MQEQTRTILIIDIKSCYASIEASERGLDAMKVNLAVADTSRSDRSICLAITPAMKKLGIQNRCRIYEIPENVPYIAAIPRMHLYLEYSAEIYAIYLKYFDKNDIHVYSVDEAFMDATDYLSLYNLSPRDLGKKIITEIYVRLGLRATCGIGSNLYLAKIALDIMAKHAPDFIAELTEKSYQELLWDHKPLHDFWRIGKRTEQKLAKYGIHTMKDIVHADEDFLYRLFGIDAELLIDHAWGREPVTIKDIKAYRPSTKSLSAGQVLPRDYSYKEGELIAREMMDQLCLELVEKKLVSDSATLYVGYSGWTFGGAHGSVSLVDATNSDAIFVPTIAKLYSSIVDPTLMVRNISICVNHTIKEANTQYNLFIDSEYLDKTKKAQRAALAVKKRFGKNALVKGMNLQEGGTAIDRNTMIGGHRSGTQT